MFATKHITHLLLGLGVWFAKSYKDALSRKLTDKTQDVVDSLDYHFVGKNAIDYNGREIISTETHWLYGSIVNRRVPNLLIKDLRNLTPKKRWHIKYLGKNKFYAKLITIIEE